MRVVGATLGQIRRPGEGAGLRAYQKAVNLAAWSELQGEF